MGIIIDCNIKTLEAGRSPDFDIRATEILCNIIMRVRHFSQINPHEAGRVAQGRVSIA